MSLLPKCLGTPGLVKQTNREMLAKYLQFIAIFRLFTSLELIRLWSQAYDLIRQLVGSSLHYIYDLLFYIYNLIFSIFRISIYGKSSIHLEINHNVNFLYLLKHLILVTSCCLQLSPVVTWVHSGK